MYSLKNEEGIKNLFLALLNTDSEDSIKKILKEIKVWDRRELWRDFGDNENNYSIIGAQQKLSEKAFVEKIVNSVDAVLMRECLKEGINPEGKDAPQSIEEALEEFFDIRFGKISLVDARKRTILAQNISIIATGTRQIPSITIVDKGEGQTPNKLPETILSLAKSNKLRIPFVQGRYNMGGTGAFRFCGTENLQLVISKRDPRIAVREKGDETVEYWGFTIVRRFEPIEGMRSSVYKYLTLDGDVLKFKADSLPLLPGKDTIAYEKQLKSGTLLKLYEYELPKSARSTFLRGFYNRISLLLPSIALPVRIYERRDFTGYSKEATLSGLYVRLEEDKRGNLVNDFPSSESVKLDGQEMLIKMYAFKDDEDGKSRKANYASQEGIVFVVDGQYHGAFTKQFFHRREVGMGYLADNILVIVDCSRFDARTREDLFMNSRDRLSDNSFKRTIEKELEQIIKNHQGLKELKQIKKEEELKSKIGDEKPWISLLDNIMKKSPTLESLFLKGHKISSPFRLTNAGIQEEFEGKMFPTFFKLLKKYDAKKPKEYFLNKRIRIQFETDAENNYFARDDYPGSFKLSFNQRVFHLSYAKMNLWKGIATLNLDIPPVFSVGELVEVKIEITDENTTEIFEEIFFLLVQNPKVSSEGGKGKRKEPTDPEAKGDRKTPLGLEIPPITEVRKNDWEKHKFTETDVIKIIFDEEAYHFYINMDNKYLLNEIKGKMKKNHKIEILNSRFKYGMALLSLSVLKLDEEEKIFTDLEDESNVFKIISDICKGMAPMLLPMIEGLSEIDVEE